MQANKDITWRVPVADKPESYKVLCTSNHPAVGSHDAEFSFAHPFKLTWPYTDTETLAVGAHFLLSMIVRFWLDSACLTWTLWSEAKTITCTHGINDTVKDVGK